MPRSQQQRTDGNTGDYPSNWRDIANAIKSSHNWRCERCFHPHETFLNRVDCDELCTHPDNGKQRMLTVHHLNMNPANCEPWNLAALCQACHLSIQARVDFEQIYMLPHSAWMVPHVKGFTEHMANIMIA